MTDDDRTDALLRRMATDEYNRPPEIVPRELMWEAVQVELGRRGSAEAGTHAEGARRSDGSRDIRELPRGARIPRWVYFAAAAAVLLAVGIQIGRRMGAGRAETQMVVVPNAPGARDTTAPSAGAPDTAPAASPDRQLASTEGAAPGRAADSRSGPRAEPRAGRSLEPDVADGAAVRAYSVAATEHLTQVEALLTTFRTDAAQGRMDAQLASWGKDLLANTRLLLDSPAARDPVRRKLLQDLELVLVQIVQLSPGAPARDRDLIKGALTDEQVLTRLRTAIPAQKGT